MPLIGLNVQQQTQAAGAGSQQYPTIGAVSKGVIWMDQFARATVNPTNAIALYNLTHGSTGTITITNQSLEFATAATLNDTEEATIAEMSLKRNVGIPTLDSKSQIELNFLFYLQQAVTEQIFVGIIFNTTTAISSLPTTAGHMGLYLDTSVDSNFRLSSANGTTQVATDTGTAVAANTLYRLQILWNGDNSATLNFYTGDTSNINADTLAKSVSVTVLRTVSKFSPGYNPHFFLKALSAAVKKWDVTTWGYAVT